MPGRMVRIGMLKALPVKWDLEANWAVFEAQFWRHAYDDLDFFITPECFLDGYAVTDDGWTPDRFVTVAQQVEQSSYIQRVREMARQAHTRIVFGFTEIVQGRFYNCALLIGANGEIVGKYHKTHLQTHDLRFAPVQDLPVFKLDIACVGILICADRRWPETMRTLRLKGAEICLMPTYGMWHLDNEWWMRTRAYENQIFVCFAHPHVVLIANPKGGLEAKLQSNVPEVLVHDVDLSQVTDDNHLADRRPELYQVLTEVKASSGAT